MMNCECVWCRVEKRNRAAEKIVVKQEFDKIIQRNWARKNA